MRMEAREPGSARCLIKEGALDKHLLPRVFPARSRAEWRGRGAAASNSPGRIVEDGSSVGRFATDLASPPVALTLAAAPPLPPLPTLAPPLPTLAPATSAAASREDCGGCGTSGIFPEPFPPLWPLCRIPSPSSPPLISAVTKFKRSWAFPLQGSLGLARAASKERASKPCTGVASARFERLSYSLTHKHKNTSTSARR